MASNGSFTLECDATSAAAVKYWVVVHLRQIVCSQFSGRVILRDGDLPWPPKSPDLSTWNFCVWVPEIRCIL